MNMLCFTPSIFKYIEEGFPRFFEENKDDLLTGEYLIPDVVEKLIIKGISFFGNKSSKAFLNSLF